MPLPFRNVLDINFAGLDIFLTVIAVPPLFSRGVRFNFVCSTALLHNITMRLNELRIRYCANLSVVRNLSIYMHHISQGDYVRHSMTKNSTFVSLVLGAANDCEMPHFTPFTLASCLFNPENCVVIFVGRSESIPCKSAC